MVNLITHFADLGGAQTSGYSNPAGGLGAAPPPAAAPMDEEGLDSNNSLIIGALGAGAVVSGLMHHNNKNKINKLGLSKHPNNVYGQQA